MARKAPQGTYGVHLQARLHTADETERKAVAVYEECQEDTTFQDTRHILTEALIALGEKRSGGFQPGKPRKDASLTRKAQTALDKLFAAIEQLSHMEFTGTAATYQQQIDSAVSQARVDVGSLFSGEMTFEDEDED